MDKKYPYACRVDTTIGEAVIYTDKYVNFDDPRELRVTGEIIQRYIVRGGRKLEGDTRDGSYSTLNNFKFMICPRGYVSPEDTWWAKETPKHSTSVNRDLIAAFPFEYVVHFEDYSVVLKTSHELPQPARTELISSFVFGEHKYLHGIMPIPLGDATRQYVLYYVAALELEPLPVKPTSDDKLNEIIETQKQTILEFNDIVDSLLNVLKINGITHV